MNRFIKYSQHKQHIHFQIIISYILSKWKFHGTIINLLLSFNEKPVYTYDTLQTH